MTKQQREFRRLSWNVMVRLWKLHGHLVWLQEKTQFDWKLDGNDVDCLYDRWHHLEDALQAFKRGELWRSVDVEDFDD